MTVELLVMGELNMKVLGKFSICFAVFLMGEFNMALAENYLVVNTNDSGLGSLRQAILNANLHATNNITFASGLDGQTITLATGQLTISSNVVIDASALPSKTTISGNGASRVLQISAPTIVTLIAVNITGGHAASGDTNIYSPVPYQHDGSSGGGIFNSGFLTLTNCTVSGNSAGNSSPAQFVVYAPGPGGWKVYGGGEGGKGGGIYNDGTLVFNYSTVSYNTGGWSSTDLGGSGGGICNVGSAQIINSIITGNRSGAAGYAFPNDNGHGGNGGGLYNSGTMKMDGTTVSGNTTGLGWGDVGGNGGNGGGASNDGNMLVANSTISGNVTGFGGGEMGYSGFGGGLYDTGTLTISNSTISANSVPNSPSSAQGGGISLLGGTVTIYNSIVAGNVAPWGSNLGSYYGMINLIGTNLVDVEPLLAPLGCYGGFTPTMPPLAGSPAIDAGVDANLPVTDQRGLPRLLGAHVGIGAVERVTTAQISIGSNPVRLMDGSFYFCFTNAPGVVFRVLASTNLASALPGWSVLDGVNENPFGQFQFTDSAASNYPCRFYRVVAP